MKYFVSILIGLIIFITIIFVIDPLIVKTIMNAIPQSAHEWFKLIKIGIWIVLIFFTIGITISLSNI